MITITKPRFVKRYVCKRRAIKLKRRGEIVYKDSVGYYWAGPTKSLFKLSLLESIL